MAWIAKEKTATTTIECDRAAPHTFPIDEIGTMFLYTAGVRTNAHCLHDTLFAKHVFLAVRIFIFHLLLAVLEAAKVWFLALEAHVEANFGFYESHQIIEVEVSFCCHSWIVL